MDNVQTIATYRIKKPNPQANIKPTNPITSINSAQTASQPLIRKSMTYKAAKKKRLYSIWTTY